MVALLSLAFLAAPLFADEAATDQCEKAKTELAVAGGHRSNGELDKAVEAYRAIVKERSSCRVQAAEAQMHIGEIYQNEKKCAEAVEAFEAVVRSFKDQPDLCVAAFGKMARTYKASGKLEQALQSYKRIIQGYPSRPADCADAMLARASIYEEKQDYGKAEIECRKLMRAYGSNPALRPHCRFAHFQICCEMKAAGRLDEARKAFEGIKDDAGDSYAAQALLKRAEIFVTQGKNDEAIQEFQSLIDRYPQHKNTWLQAKFLLADVYLDKGDMESARAIVKEISEGEAIKGFGYLYYDLMSLQHRCGDAAWRDSAKKYIKYKSTSSDRGQADFPPVEIAFNFENDLPKAQKLAVEFVEKHPNHPLAATAAFMRGSCLLATGDKEGALAVFDTLIATYSKLPDARSYTNAALEASADIVLESGRPDEAIRRIERMDARTATEKASKLDKMGRVYVRVKDWAQATTAFDRAVRTPGASADTIYTALFDLGNCYYRTGDIAAARACMSRVASKEPDSQQARKAQAMLYLWSTAEGGSW